MTISTSSTYNLNLPSGYQNGITITGSGVIVNFNNINATFNTAANILVQDGAKLIINGGVYNFNDNCEVKLNFSGEISINNSTLRHNGSIGSFWKGITIFSIYSTPQFSTYPTINGDGTCNDMMWSGVLNPSMPKLFLIGSTIEQATQGVVTHGNGPHNYWDGQSIVRIRNSKFKNCEQGVVLNTNYDYVKPEYNASHIMKTEFEWTNDLNMNKPNMRHIWLQNTHSLNIGGCVFSNNDASNECFLDKGVGVYAIKSSFSLKSDGDKCCVDELGCPDNCYMNNSASRRNEFNKLGIGIYYEGKTPFKTDNKFSVKKADFNNCALSIQIYNTREAAIGDCKFLTNTSVYNQIFNTIGCSNYNEMLSIWHSNSSGVKIFDNEFETNLDNHHFIHTESPDFFNHSSIRNNKFSSTYLFQDCNENIVGIFLNGNNNNLDIICNEFIGVGYDIKVGFDGQLDDIPNMSVRSQSPLPKYSIVNPKNIHSNVPLTCYYNISNEGNSILNIKKYANLSYNPIINSNVTIDFPNASDATYIFENNTTNQQYNTVDCNLTCTKLENKPTSIKYYTFENLSLYPNPSLNGIFNVNIGDFTELKYQIYDINGSLIKDGICNNENNVIKIEINGLYIIRFYNDNSQSVVKVIVE